MNKPNPLSGARLVRDTINAERTHRECLYERPDGIHLLWRFPLKIKGTLGSDSEPDAIITYLTPEALSKWYQASRGKASPLPPPHHRRTSTDAFDAKGTSRPF